MPDSTKPEPSDSPQEENTPPQEQSVRLNKAIADSGYCARRKADELIQAGKVQVNGQTVTELGTRIHPTRDSISIDGKPLSHAEKAYLLFNKPTGYVTSRKGGRSQKTIYELIPPQYQSVDPAGRLDQDSSGALILSNDGDFLYQITHPKFHLPKIYEITLDRALTLDEINQLLIERATAGKQVVRLKGGDPFLFGRGGEEASALVAAGVPFEIVPGISSALAVPAYAGIPLTHRGLASSVTIVAGSRAGDGSFSEELENAANADTIVILMGMAHLRWIAGKLTRLGRAADTPVAVIRWGTYETQQIVTGTLQNIADLADRQHLRPPAVIVIGDVVRLHDQLDWFTRRFTQAEGQEVAALAAA